MKTVQFLADANLDQDIILGVMRRQPLVEFALPQQFLPDGTPDLEVLAIAAKLDSILVTHDVRTMPFHFAAFIQENRSPGLIIVPSKLSIALAIEELIMVWSASTPEEWVNQYRRLPL